MAGTATQLGMLLALCGLLLVPAGAGSSHLPFADAPRSVASGSGASLPASGAHDAYLAAAAAHRYCEGVLWTWGISARYAPSYCYGHDEPTMSYFSSAAGSGANARFHFVLPSDSGSYAQGQFYVAFWIGGTVHDTNSTAGGSQGVLELQFYPAAPQFTGSGSGPKDCFPDGSFSPSYSAGANRWFACAIVWQIVCGPLCLSATENAAYAQPVDVGVGSSILEYSSGDTLFVNLTGTAMSTTAGWGINVADATLGSSGSLTLKNGTLVLSPYFATASPSNIVTWAASGLGAVGFAYEVGHAFSNLGGSCTPGDLTCDSYWPGRWAASGQVDLALPRLGSGTSPKFTTTIGFSSSQGGEAEVNGSTCGSPSTSPSKNCLYPYYTYRSGHYGFDFGTGGAPNQTSTFGGKYQFPARTISSGAYAKNVQTAPWGTVSIAVIGRGAADLNFQGTATPVPLSSHGTASVPVADGRYWLNTSSPGCSPISQSVYVHTRAVDNLVVNCPGIWTKLAPSSHPTARGYVGLTYDGKDGYDLLFGGYNLSVGALSDTWDYGSGTWTQLTPISPPSARSSMGLVYDAADHYVLLFGGVASNSSALGDTWTYAGGTWTHLSLSSAPSARSGMGMTYDTVDGYVVLFGGFDSAGHALNDTWKFVSGAWTNVSSTAGPAPRGEPALTYDGHDGYVVLFGGASTAVSTPTYYSDTWTFSAGTWTQIFPASSPPGRSDAVAEYDGTVGHVILEGGFDASGALGTTWEFVGGTWTNVTSSTAPSARSDVGLTYDGSTLSSLLFGGAASPAYSSQTWKYT
ncbi:MAG: hypothetical protein L3K01_04000 [Thermoplasmata archaeon]|nr:hypothetical protein [Thermoplasmata archaeon]